MSSLGQNQHQSALQFLHVLLENMSQGVLFINSEGQIAVCNKEAENLLQLSRQEVLLRPYSEVLKNALFQSSIKSALCGAKDRCFSLDCFGKTLFIETKLLHQDGLEGLCIFFQDTTKKTALEKKALQKSHLEELGKMSATLSHEIKNPLGSIIGYSSLIASHAKDVGVKKMAEKIATSTKSLQHLTTCFLACINPLKPRTLVGDFKKQLQETLEFFRMDPNFQEVTIEIHMPDESFVFPFDKEQIHRLIFNLLLNAAEASLEKKKIIIGLFKRSNNCVLTISDEGIGFDEKTAKNLFSPFFTTKKQGSGLGLFAAEKIAKEHLGSLEARSNQKLGSTFTLTLPLQGRL